MRDIKLNFVEDFINIKIGKFSAGFVWPLITFKEKGDRWFLGLIEITEEEKAYLISRVDNHFKYKENKLITKTIKIGNMLFDKNRSMDKRLSKLEEEREEFIESLEGDDKELMIDELWDMWTSGVNILQDKGIDIEDIMRGYDKNLDKKFSRNYKFGDIK